MYKISLSLIFTFFLIHVVNGSFRARLFRGRRANDHMLPNGQKAPLLGRVLENINTEEAKKIEELKLKQQRKIDEIKKEDQKEIDELKEAAEAKKVKENVEPPKRLETKEEKFVKEEMGLHPPGTPVQQGSFQVDSNQIPSTPYGGSAGENGYVGYPAGFGGFPGGYYPGYGGYTAGFGGFDGSFSNAYGGASTGGGYPYGVMGRRKRGIYYSYGY